MLPWNKQKTLNLRGLLLKFKMYSEFQTFFSSSISYSLKNRNPMARRAVKKTFKTPFWLNIYLRRLSNLCDVTREYEIEGRYNWRGPPYHMLIHALQKGTPIVSEIFKIGYCMNCIRGNCTSDKYFLFKCSTVCKACIVIW